MTANCRPTTKPSAYAFAAQPGRLLLVIDNAEDLMHTEESQLAFRDQLDVLLAASTAAAHPAHHPLAGRRDPAKANSRWTSPPLPAGADGKPAREGATSPRRLSARSGRPAQAWEELLDLFDGHPRTLWLAARQLAGQAASLERVVARLRELKEDAVLDADLVGRKDVYEALAKDKKARLRSLVAGMDLSFEVLAENRHPPAIEVFLALSLFPAGLPEVVARAVAGEEGRDGLDQLLRVPPGPVEGLAGLLPSAPPLVRRTPPPRTADRRGELPAPRAGRFRSFRSNLRPVHG